MPDHTLWNEEANAKVSENVEHYGAELSATASNRSFLDIEPNISVRTDFTKDDYYRFRPGEAPGQSFKDSMRKCMKAYEKVGIIKNVIDLMGDFGSQGITLHHTDKKIQTFYRKWWDMAHGTERSERFLNTLYRCGNVFINKRYGKLTGKQKKEMAKAIDSIEIVKDVVYKKSIPLKYDFLNPLSIEVVSGFAGAFSGQQKYKMEVSDLVRKSFKQNKGMIDKLPESIRPAMQDGDRFIQLDSRSLEVFHYKKDDWDSWANPMINPIIDDIFMLEKMKLADMSALDGAISNIRLWQLGSLEHQILPNKAAIDRLRNILASNVGGGTLDLVWGPELNFKESNSMVYKFLGDEKYIPVLNSIYAGIGIPPTLTGLAGQSGGFSNNFISLKTLIERLEYGRGLLRQFWQKEVEYIQKSMGFSSPPIIHFDFMLLSDEAAEKNLLIQLADRNVISVETLRARFGEVDSIEESRIKSEQKKRKARVIPPQADPYHNGNLDDELVKMAVQNGTLSIDKVTEIDPKDVKELPQKVGLTQQKKPSKPNNGRPKLSKDQSPRKQKRVLPRTTPKSAASLLVWSQEAQKKIAEIVNPAILSSYKKKNLRELSRTQAAELEEIKFDLQCKIPPYSSFTRESIAELLTKNEKPDPIFNQYKEKIHSEFVIKNERLPSTDELRSIYAITYSFCFSDKE